MTQQSSSLTTPAYADFFLPKNDTVLTLPNNPQGAQVKVAVAATGNDLPKQVWNIAS